MVRTILSCKGSRPVSHPLPDTLTHPLSSRLELGKSWLQTLSWLIIGLAERPHDENARTMSLSPLASQCSSSAQVSSSYRRLRRFFQYVTLEGDWLALAVIKLLKLKAPWALCLDRTNWRIGRHDVNIPMLAIATRRLRIPLMWTLLDKAGSSNQCERIALMRRYLALFGSGSIAWLLADRAFIGGRWINFLLENNILFAIGVKENSKIRLEDGRGHQTVARTLPRRVQPARRGAARRGPQPRSARTRCRAPPAANRAPRDRAVARSGGRPWMSMPLGSNHADRRRRQTAVIIFI